MNKPTTQIVNWNRSAVEAAVDLLADGWNREGPLDLSDLLVLTQTKGAGGYAFEVLKVLEELPVNRVTPIRRPGN